MKRPEMFENLEKLIFTWPVGVLGGIGGGFYTAMIASPENPQDMRYILGGLAVGSVLGFCLDVLYYYPPKK